MWLFSSPGLYPAAKRIHLKLIPNIPAAAAKTLLQLYLLFEAFCPRRSRKCISHVGSCGRGLRSSGTKSVLVLVPVLVLVLVFVLVLVLSLAATR